MIKTIDEEKIVNVFVDVAMYATTTEEMINALRSLNSDAEITDDEYNYILSRWDELLCILDEEV